MLKLTPFKKRLNSLYLLDHLRRFRLFPSLPVRLSVFAAYLFIGHNGGLEALASPKAHEGGQYPFVVVAEHRAIADVFVGRDVDEAVELPMQGDGNRVSDGVELLALGDLGVEVVADKGSSNEADAVKEDVKKAEKADVGEGHDWWGVIGSSFLMFIIGFILSATGISQAMVVGFIDLVKHLISLVRKQ